VGGEKIKFPITADNNRQVGFKCPITHLYALLYKNKYKITKIITMGMLIKIKGTNQERFGETVISVMNLACVCFRRGNIYGKKDLVEYWYENTKENKFELLPTANNHKAFIRDRGENFIVIEFYSRYDVDDKEVNSLSNLVLSFFSDDEVEKVKDYYVPKNKM
jgi:hypothetical protein